MYAGEASDAIGLKRGRTAAAAAAAILGSATSLALGTHPEPERC